MSILVNPYRYASASGATGPGASWPYYVETTIPAASIGSTLASFPVYVNLASLPAGFWSNVKSDGGDIRVFDSTGSTEMPRHIVSINTGASTGELHFKASTLDSSSDTTYRVYYGNAGASNYAASATYGLNNVWSDYVLVLLNGSGGDATGKHAVTASGGLTTGGATGKVGAATTFDGVNDYLSVTDHADFDFGSATDFTLQAWIKTTATATSEIIVKPTTNSAPVSRLVMQNNGGTYAARAVLNDGTNSASAHGTTAINTGSWVSLHAVFDRDGNVVMYVNASSDATASAASVGSVDTSTDLTIGAWPAAAAVNFLAGDLDDVRVRRNALSSAWVAAEYLNQNTPATFYSVGTQTANS